MPTRGALVLSSLGDTSKDLSGTSSPGVQLILGLDGSNLGYGVITEPELLLYSMVGPHGISCHMAWMQHLSMSLKGPCAKDLGPSLWLHWEGAGVSGREGSWVTGVCP